MEILPSYKILDWPFKDYKFVSDLIEYEGPLLVHYMQNEKHALFYWVEGDGKFNRWVCFEITVVDFYDYLHKGISLYQLMEKKKNEAFFITDIDSKLNYTNFQMMQGYAIPDSYLPDTESYYLPDISPLYEKIFAKEEKSLYIPKLRERSIDLVIEPSSDRYGGTNSLSECREFLDGIDECQRNFNAFHSFNHFKQKVSDLTKLSRMVREFAIVSEYRMANVFQNSFHISLSPDVAMKNTGMKDVDELRTQLSDKFVEDVLRKDFNNEEDIKDVLSKYDDHSRNKIFKPLIKVINNPSFNLTFIDKKVNKSRTYNRVTPNNKKKITPKIEETQPQEELKKIFYTITLEVDANTDLATISKKDIQGGLLFSQKSEIFEQEIQKFDLDKYIVWFKEPVILKHTHESDGYVISFEPLSIAVKGDSMAVTGERLLDEFEKKLEQDYLSNPPVNSKNKKYFDNNIAEIKNKADI